jgi:hypothetical protein
MGRLLLARKASRSYRCQRIAFFRLSCRPAPRVVNRGYAELFTALEFSIQQHPIGHKLIDSLC